MIVAVWLLEVRIGEAAVRPSGLAVDKSAAGLIVMTKHGAGGIEGMELDVGTGLDGAAMDVAVGLDGAAMDELSSQDTHSQLWMSCEPC